MHVLHALWTDGALHLWAESLERLQESWNPVAEGSMSKSIGPKAEAATALLEEVRTEQHAFALGVTELTRMLEPLLGTPDAPSLLARSSAGMPTLALPRDGSGALPSERMASAAGILEVIEASWLGRFQVPCLVVDPVRTLSFLISLESAEPPSEVEYGHDLRYWIEVGRFTLDLLIHQRFVPTLFRSAEAGLQARWLPWLHDEAAQTRVGHLLSAMPPVVRSAEDRHEGRPWSILQEALQSLVDLTVRQALIAENYLEAIEDRDPNEDLHVAMLTGLLSDAAAVQLPPEQSTDLLKDLSTWVGRLDEGRRDRPFTLCLRLSEPPDSARLPDLEPLGDAVRWRLSFHLIGSDDQQSTIDAEQVWRLDGGPGAPTGQRVGRLEELLLTEIARAGGIFPGLQSALGSAAPTGVNLTTSQAYGLLTEYRPLLEESGFIMEVPAWWDDPASWLGARLQVHAPDLTEARDSNGIGSFGPSLLGLRSLVRFQWKISVGDQPLSQEEFERLTRQAAPLMRVRGRWVQLQPDQIEAARQFLRESPGGETTLLEAIQLAHGLEARRPKLPMLGMDADGWVGDLLGTGGRSWSMPDVEQPESLHGHLRPYQRMGLSWLVFLDTLGLGACLADDMGLGKTVQLIALLLHERAQRSPEEEGPGPTLLLVPTSLIVNWVRELHRFAPNLTVHVQHGPDRPSGDAFVHVAGDRDVVITTYGLVIRDLASLKRIRWRRVVLDEAQYIKNPPTKQTTAIRSLGTDRRVALTGTPVENRLSELWSIMEFCNPGYLGSAGEFRRRFSVPIERHRDQQRAGVLRQLVRPFVLRRLKTDPAVIDDLPDCLQTKEYANLSVEQAALYEQVVGSMLSQVDRTEGIQRRGLVLATLVKLKQVCNHPALLTGSNLEHGSAGDGAGLSSRSGKTSRLISMLEEIVATGDRALVFTQFRKMGHLLTAMIQHDLDAEALFLHGGTPQVKRQQMIDRFQDPGGGAPVFILSLKAGGTGLNLTAATHVFHFDRWWNPAVENQATDRAFRIGQTRTVHVHKFVCVGTLEERIDQMIEQKMELAQNIVGSGEGWLTELSTLQLRDVLTLRQTALEGDA